MQQASPSFCAQTIVHAVVIDASVLAILLSMWIGGVRADSVDETSQSASKESSYSPA